jgi:N-acetylglutamate synthase-like GNAT family acetyltransferase
MVIRKATEADIPQLLRLMRELARFEKYADAFAVTEEVLREQGSVVRRPTSTRLSPAKTAS